MKSRLDDLVCFGGRPEFAEPLHVGRPNVGDRAVLRARFDTILDRRWLTNDGPFVREFEHAVAERVGARFCVAICNATMALALCCRACGLRGEAIVPSFTFAAPVHVLSWMGVEPVFCDIDARSHVVAPSSVEALVTNRTSAIVAVHVWGRACPVEPLHAIASRHGLMLVFDAAHALGSTRDGMALGAAGDASVFSFHATKVANSFEGGMVATNDEALARELRKLRNFGFSEAGEVVSVGVNAKMTEVAAAMGITSLESLDSFIDIGRQRQARYRQGLQGLPGVACDLLEADPHTNGHYVVVEFDEAATGIHRDQVIDLLTMEGVIARRYFAPGCHRLAPYRQGHNRRGHQLEVTNALCERVLQLPTGSAISNDDVDRVVALVRLIAGHGDDIRRRLDRGAGDAVR